MVKTTWIGEGSFKPDDTTTIVFSAKKKGGGKKESGVAVILRREAHEALDPYTPVSGRTIVVRLKAKPKQLTIIQVYAPPSTHSESTIDDFYTALDKVAKGDIWIVMGDPNAKVGKMEDTKCGLGKFEL